MVPGTWYLLSGIWYLVSGIWHLVIGIWHLAPGTWYLAPGIWYTGTVSGICYRASATCSTQPRGCTIAGPAAQLRQALEHAGLAKWQCPWCPGGHGRILPEVGHHAHHHVSLSGLMESHFGSPHQKHLAGGSGRTSRW